MKNAEKPETPKNKKRMAMLECSLGKNNTLTCVEDEPVVEFEVGMLLCLLPPLEIRRGLCLLKKHNVIVVHSTIKP